MALEFRALHVTGQKLKICWTANKLALGRAVGSTGSTEDRWAVAAEVGLSTLARSEWPAQGDSGTIKRQGHIGYVFVH